MLNAPLRLFFMVLWVLFLCCSILITGCRPQKRKEQQEYEGSAKNGEMAEMSFEEQEGRKRSGTRAPMYWRRQ